jgi:predicted esterase
MELDFHHRFVAAEADESWTLLLLHGTGGDEDDLLELGRLLSPGAALLSPRGKVLENGMPRFFRRDAEGRFDREDLIRRTGELAGFLKAAAERYRFDPSRIVAVGYSNGANIAAALLLLKPAALAGAVLFHAMVPLQPADPPDLRGVPVFLAAGRLDGLIPPEESKRLARLLESAGALVTMAWQPEGHQLTRAEAEAARQWLQGLNTDRGRGERHHTGHGSTSREVLHGT